MNVTSAPISNPIVGFSENKTIPHPVAATGPIYVTSEPEKAEVFLRRVCDKNKNATDVIAEAINARICGVLNENALGVMDGRIIKIEIQNAIRVLTNETDNGEISLTSFLDVIK